MPGKKKKKRKGRKKRRKKKRKEKKKKFKKMDWANVFFSDGLWLFLVGFWFISFRFRFGLGGQNLRIFWSGLSDKKTGCPTRFSWIFGWV